MIFLSHADQMSCKRSGSIYVGQGREQDAEPLSNGHVRYELKMPYRDGTTHVIFESMDFIARLVARVPKPRVNLTRFHGVFAPNSAHRAQVTPTKRGKGNKARTADAPEDTTPAGRSRHPASRGISASLHVNAGPP
jgi:hypothetical protein